MNSMDVFGTYLSFVAPVLSDIKEMKRRNEEKIKDIYQEYHEVTVNLPRKKKKARRKILKVDWRFYHMLNDDAMFNFNF